MSNAADSIVAFATVAIPISPTLIGDLVIPKEAIGIVVFAHGSGSSRQSPRNQSVAAQLQEAGFATLLFDLLTPNEQSVDEGTGRFRFDVAMLGDRLARVTRWLFAQRDTYSLPVAYFGAGAGAAAALIAAAKLPGLVRAVVSRGGRPDLANDHLKHVRAPTLLVVGGSDTGGLEMNRTAFGALGARVKELKIVPQATHLFEEPDALESVGTMAADWFRQYLPPHRRPRS